MAWFGVLAQQAFSSLSRPCYSMAHRTPPCTEENTELESNSGRGNEGAGLMSAVTLGSA